MKEKFKIWLKAACVRACRTMGQSAISIMGSAVILQDVNWLMLLSSTVLTGILSMATSAAGLPEINEKHCKKCWAAAAAERAIKTMCQTFLSMAGSAVTLQEVNWAMIGSATLLSGIASLITSATTSLPEVEGA